MLTLPEIVDRPAQPYLFIPFTVTMDTFKVAADEGFPALFSWMEERGIAPAGAAFFNYRRIDMAATLDVEAGVAVAAPVEGEGRVRSGTLPAGRYARVVWTGPYDQLYDVNAFLIGWAKERGIAWDVVEKPDGDHFACRVEIYETDPMEEPDSSKWVTELAIKLAD